MSDTALFGSILSLPNDSGTIVFVAVMIFLTFFEGALHVLEKVGGKRGYRGLIMKLYREFMILGFISFAIELTSNITSLPENDRWYEAFRFAHIVILFVGITFLIQSLLLVSLIASRNKRLLYYDSCSSESLFVDFLQLHDSQETYLKFLFNYGPVSIPIPELREKIEYKILQEFFIRSYQLDPKFKFANYMCKILKNYIISLVEVRPVNWFRVGFLVALNYLRILLIDPIYESAVCEQTPSTEYTSDRSPTYGHHVCAEYQLRIIFVGIAAMMIYIFAVLFMSEIYIQRLIGKVLDDEETLQWLDSEEANEGTRASQISSSLFPHPVELLNSNETLFRNNGKTEIIAVPTVENGNRPRFSSESEAKKEVEMVNKQFRRSSIRRSLSYKSPLNDGIASDLTQMEPIQEAPIAAPPQRGAKRRASITINVPIHRDSLPEVTRASMNSMEEVKALTTDVNTFNRRHLYLKCLERIINLEYSYHETEARRSSITSESEVPVMKEMGSGKQGRHNSGRIRPTDLHKIFSASPSVSGRKDSETSAKELGVNTNKLSSVEASKLQLGEGLERIQQLKTMKMKYLRELMIKSKSVGGETMLSPGGSGDSMSSPVSPNPGGVALLSPFRLNQVGNPPKNRKRGSIFGGNINNPSPPLHANSSGNSIPPPPPPPPPDDNNEQNPSNAFSLAALFDPVSPSPKTEKRNFFDNPMSSSAKKYNQKPKIESKSSIEMTDVNTQSSNLKEETVATTTSKKNEEGRISPPLPDRGLNKGFTTKFFEFVPQEDKNDPNYQRMRAMSSDLSTSHFMIAWQTVIQCLGYVFTKSKQIASYILMMIIQGGSFNEAGEANEGIMSMKRLASSSSALEDIKELENDFRAIFAWKNPFIYYISIEFSLLLQCMYVALWATNFSILATESSNVVLWEIALLVPMLCNFLLLKQIIYISCLLQSIIKIDKTIANKISEEAIEERSVTQRLRRMIRDKLKEMTNEKRQWKNLLYSYYMKVMDENEEITRKEWKHFLYSLTLQLTNNSTRQLFKVIDQDQDGFIHWNDLYMIVFPDFLKKKVKIKRKKVKKPHRRGSTTKEEGRENQFSVEYQISEEDRKSYKRKTARASVLSSSMKMIRTSLIPSSASSHEMMDRNSVSSLASDKSSPFSIKIHKEEKNDDTSITEEGISKGPRSILKSSSIDKLQLDMNTIYQSTTGGSTTTGSRKQSVSFDDEKLVSTSTIGDEDRRKASSPIPPDTTAYGEVTNKSSSYVGKLWQQQLQSSDDGASLGSKSDRSRNLRQGSIFSPSKSVPSSVLNVLKRTFSVNMGHGNNSDEEDEEDDDDAMDEDDDDKDLGSKTRNHRLHSFQSSIQEEDEEDISDEEHSHSQASTSEIESKKEEGEIEKEEEQEHSHEEHESDISELSSGEDEIPLRRSLRSMTISDRRAFLGLPEEGSNVENRYSAKSIRSIKSENYVDI